MYAGQVEHILESLKRVKTCEMKTDKWHTYNLTYAADFDHYNINIA